MKIALTTKKFITQKEEKSEFYDTTFWRKCKLKKPPGRPPPLFPPPFPSCESPTTCKDETYRGSRRPSYRIRHQMARKKKKHPNKLYSTKYEKKDSRKRMTYSSTPQRDTPTHIHTKSFKTHYKFIAIYRIQQREASSAWAAAGKTEWQETNFMKLFISIQWIALTTENFARNPLP